MMWRVRARSCSVEFDSRPDRLQGERTNAIQGSGRSYEGAGSTHRSGEAENRVPRLALDEPSLRAPRPECGATARRRAIIWNCARGHAVGWSVGSHREKQPSSLHGVGTQGPANEEEGSGPAAQAEGNDFGN